jgi:hypothetical protein
MTSRASVVHVECRVFYIVMLSVFMPGVIMMNVVMLNVVAPNYLLFSSNTPAFITYYPL